MIDGYIKSSRRTKAPIDQFRKQYEEYFSGLCSNLLLGSDIPKLKITYSTERRCELVKIKDSSFIVYDQYMGQSFNRLNRVHMANHGVAELSKAYGCKYIAEKLVVESELNAAAFFGLLNHQFIKVANKNERTFEFDPEKEVRRNQLTIVQEIFIMSHELAHFIFEKNIQMGRDPSKTTENALLEFIKDKEEVVDSNHYQEIVKRYGKRVAQNIIKDNESRGQHYLNVFNTKKDALIEEAFADDMGAYLSFNLARDKYSIPDDVIVEGILTGHKYLRLFQHLDKISKMIVKLANAKNNTNFCSLLKNIDKSVWGDDGGIAIGFTQFREHFLRDRLALLSAVSGSDPNSYQCNLSDTLDSYDEKIEFPITLELVSRLKKILKFEHFSDINDRKMSKGELLSQVDNMTGWSNEYV